VAASAPIPVDEQGRVDVDLPCLECGYNLRTLSLDDGRCPECELPVGRSAVGNKLRYCDPAWVRQIVYGFNNIGMAMVLIGLGFIGLQVISPAPVGITTRPSQGWLVGTIYSVFAAVLAVVCCYGAWKSTKPDPMTKLDERTVSWRKMARYLTIGFVAFFFVRVSVWTAVVYAVGTEPRGMYEWNDASWNVWLLIGIAALASVACYAGSLAGRADRRWLGWLLVVIASTVGLAGGSLTLTDSSWFGWRWEAIEWIDSLLPPVYPPNHPQASQHYAWSGRYHGPLRLGPWQVEGIEVVLSNLREWLIPVLIGAVISMAAAILWLWPTIWREARLAWESWAGA